MYVIKGNIFIFSSKKEHWRTWLTITVTNTPAFYHLFKTGMQILSSCAFLSGNDTVQTPFYYLQFAPEKIGPDKKEMKRKNKVLILFLILTTHPRFLSAILVIFLSVIHSRFLSLIFVLDFSQKSITDLINGFCSLAIWLRARVHWKGDINNSQTTPFRATLISGEDFHSISNFPNQSPFGCKWHHFQVLRYFVERRKQIPKLVFGVGAVPSKFFQISEDTMAMEEQLK